MTRMLLDRVQWLLHREVYLRPRSGTHRARLVRIEGYLIGRLLRVIHAERAKATAAAAADRS